MDSNPEPIMKEENSKETMNLLDLLSESDSEVSDLVLTPKKKKVKRRYRPGSTVRMKHSSTCGCGRSETRTITLWLAAVLITFWLIALSWLTIILYGELRKMDITVRSEKSNCKLWKWPRCGICYSCLESIVAEAQLDSEKTC